MHSSNGSISDASNAASIASAMKLPPSCPPGSRPRIITQHCRDGSAGHTPMRPSISKSFSSVNLRSPTSDRPAHVPAGDKHVLLLPITGDMRMASLATKTVVPSISAMPTIPSFSSAQVVPRTSEEVSHSAFSVSSRQTDAPTRGGCRTPTSMVSTSSTRPLNLHQSTQNTTPSKSNLTPITRPRASSTSSSLREVLANPQYVPNVSSESMSMFKAQNARFDRLANYLLSVIQRHQTEKAQYEERIAAFEMELQKRERELKGLRWLVRNGSMAQEFFDRTTSLDKILSTPSDMGDETDYLRTPLADLEAVAASISCPIKLGRSDSDHSPRIRQGQGEKPVGMLKRSNTMPEMLPGTLHKISTPETSPSGKTFGGLGLDFPLPGPLSLSSISSTIFSTTSTANASTSGDPNMASSGLSTIEESAHHSRLVPRNYGIPELSDERPVSGYSLSSTDSSLQHLPSSQVELDNSQSGKSSSYSSGLAHMEEMYDRLVGLSTKMRENAHGSSESLTTR
ncbi:hypothetical protein BD410DRAFT_792062 [Rickenella mellea]|uniref:Uncharacterized protein n=1 Tax=Rickenella mellea TaxID=50990 RepID=A0A4Y7PX31_9AGAM|nr:hypothetical protein BD410DRAFT_792062 [Rickenella mellea]